MNEILFIGIGNPGRQDDGLGPSIVEHIGRWNLEHVSTEIDYQLCIEHAELVQGHHSVFFVDADRHAPAPYRVNRILPSPAIAFTTHALQPEGVLAVCEQAFGHVPQAWLIGVRGYEFDLGEQLSDRARENENKTLCYMEELIRSAKLERG